MRHAIALTALLGAALPAQGKVGSPVPDLEFSSSANFGKIKAKKLSNLRGSAVLIELWATW
jgi:hypothetical protein